MMTFHLGMAVSFEIELAECFNGNFPSHRGQKNTSNEIMNGQANFDFVWHAGTVTFWIEVLSNSKRTSQMLQNLDIIILAGISDF